MSNEGAAVKVGVKYAKIEKWENDAEGKPIKSKPPLQVLEKHGEHAPFVQTFLREDVEIDSETGDLKWR